MEPKNYIIRAFFSIEAKDAEEAWGIASEMQEAANDSQQKYRHKRFLLLDEITPIREGEVGIIVREYD